MQGTDTTYTVWVIEPLEPLIVRDGRPFGPHPGARAVSLRFPFPSTTTGGVRTRAGLDATGRFDSSTIPEVKRIEVRGPLLVELDEAGQISQYLPPAPADALLLDGTSKRKSDESTTQGERDMGSTYANRPDSATGGAEDSKPVTLLWLRPRLLPGGALTNLPDGLLPVSTDIRNPSKPLANPPGFWAWPAFERWLFEPSDRELKLAELGGLAPMPETRMHVSIRTDTQTAAEGALFATQGLEFTALKAPQVGDQDAVRLSSAVRLALAVAVSNAMPRAHNITPGVAPLGGERRIVCWRKASEGEGKGLPLCPPALRERIAEDGACRLILLTPACFQMGWRPDWLFQPRYGVKPHLCGAVVGRPQVVSGWDFEKNRAKPSRRLAPAGSVFFLRLEGSRQDKQEWVDRHWMQCISDDEQDRLDGFGLAAGCM
jgi:CRISPR-associated protein Cmr3